MCRLTENFQSLVQFTMVPKQSQLLSIAIITFLTLINGQNNTNTSTPTTNSPTPQTGSPTTSEPTTATPTANPTYNGSCIYEQDYIYFTIPDDINGTYDNYTGLYVKNEELGIEGLDADPGKFDVPCGIPLDGYFSGSYVFQLLNSNPPLYMYQYYSYREITFPPAQLLIISPEICSISASDVYFQTEQDETSYALPATRCDWSQMDRNGANITWLYKKDDSNIVIDADLRDTSENATTDAPTRNPTQSPVPTTAFPTSDPTTAFPTTDPTEPSQSPTKVPTKAPTIRPTKLPTPESDLYLDPICVAMTVTNLDLAFPQQGVYIYILFVFSCVFASF